MISFFFFFNDTATTEIYTLSLHDALPIFLVAWNGSAQAARAVNDALPFLQGAERVVVVTVNQVRSEEHTSELQSPDHLVCRLLLEKKKIGQHKKGRPMSTGKRSMRV